MDWTRFRCSVNLENVRATLELSNSDPFLHFVQAVADVLGPGQEDTFMEVMHNRVEDIVISIRNADLVESAAKLEENGVVPWRIDKITFEHQNHIVLHLDKKDVASSFAKAIFGTRPLELYGYSASEFLVPSDKVLMIKHEELLADDMSSVRIFVFVNALKNVAAANRFKIDSSLSSLNATKLYVTKKTSLPDGYTSVLCAAVVDSRRHKADYTYTEYLQKLTHELISNNRNDIARRLAKACIIFSMLSVKQDRTALCPYIESPAVNRKAIRILYNYARLSAILRSFDEGVACGMYRKLPPSFNADVFHQFTMNEEWKLILNYILQFPRVVKTTMEDITLGKFSVHLLCSYLHSLAIAVSTYYRRTKILTGKYGSEEILFARIYVISAIHTVLRNGMRMLGIEPVDRM